MQSSDINPLPEEVVGAVGLAMIMRNFPKPENQTNNQWVMYCIDLMYRVLTREYTQPISQEQISFDNPQIAEIRRKIEEGSAGFIEQYGDKIPTKIPPTA